MSSGNSSLNIYRLKRRLVQGAVEENLDLIRGRTPGWRAHRAARRTRTSLWRRALLLAVLPLGVLISAYALAMNAPEETLARARGWVTPGSAQAPPTLESSPSPGAASDASLVASLPLRHAPATPRFSDAELAALPTTIDPAVFPLAVRRVVLDPGHGGASPGTRTGGGLTEKQVTLDIAMRLARILAEDGLEVVLTRDRDVDVDLRQRARLANEEAADIFVSIHVNWIDDGSTRGVETYYLGTTDDPYLNRLAASENESSGYPMADLRHLLDRIVTGVRVSKSQELATSVQQALFRSLRKVNPKLKDRGVKSAPFLVLVETEMPAILAEVSCMSNAREAELLGKPLYRQFIAEALAEGIGSYAQIDGPSESQAR